MKKMLFVLAVFLLAAFAGAAAAEDMQVSQAPISPAPVEDCKISTEVLIEPVPHYMVVKFIFQDRFGDDKMGLFASFVHALKEEPAAFYLYKVAFSPGDYGVGMPYETPFFSGVKDPKWLVPGCRFSGADGYVFSGWEIYGEIRNPGDVITLTEYESTAAAVWQTA